MFALDNTELADSYRPYGRALMVVDESVHEIYGDAIRAYFAHHDIALTVVPVQIRETAKSLETFERIVGEFDAFGLVRTEPVLVVGGGLTTDVAGFACASYRRNTPYIRIPTTLIGLIDASVSIKVAVNYGKHKNRLGAYHASQKVLLDFSFLETLPEDQVRNGMAELIKISVVGNSEIFDLLEKYGPELLRTRFGHLDGHARTARGRRPTHLPGDRHDARTRGAQPARDRPRPRHRLRPHLESDTGADAARRRSSTATRSTSTWRCRRPSPSSAATCRSSDRDRVLGVMSGLGLSLDSEYLTPELLAEATASILKTRDGMLRAAIPDPIGHVPLPQRRHHRRTGRHADAAQEDLPRLPPRRRRHRHVHRHRRRA